jgi:hypothetical protein
MTAEVCEKLRRLWREVLEAERAERDARHRLCVAEGNVHKAAAALRQFLTALDVAPDVRPLHDLAEASPTTGPARRARDQPARRCCATPARGPATSGPGPVRRTGGPPWFNVRRG